MLEYNVIAWKGVDGTTFPSTPKNSLFLNLSGHPGSCREPQPSKGFRPWACPCLSAGTNSAGRTRSIRAYLAGSDDINNSKALAGKYAVEFVTLKEYLDKYGAKPEKTIYLAMNDFDKWLTWGLGGDQVRVMDRKVEGLLLAAELFDAAAAAPWGQVASRVAGKGLEGSFGLPKPRRGPVRVFAVAG